MLDSCENSRTDLSTAAMVYRNWGWSLIPIRGDSDPRNPKAAAVQWIEYQRRQPTDEEIESWFGDGRFLGLGIVCGRVSRLAVLDFDDPQCAAAFADSLPDLVETFAVESGVRGLPHYYYHVPDDVQVRGQRVSGADLQFERTYVVASPTTVSGTEWRAVDDRQPYVLSQRDVERIDRFLTAWRYLSQVNDEDRRLFSDSVGDDLVTVSTVHDAASDRLEGDVLVGWYRRLARSGRNNALFRVTCLARDNGWSRAAIQALLLDVHVAQPPTNPHHVETPEQRRHEGYQTIQSAFRYAVRPRTASRRTSLRGLPNAIREALLQLQQSSVARVLDGLRLAGIDTGRVVTERIVCQALRVFNIGRRTVQAALKSVNAAGHAIFESPRNPPEKRANAAKAEEKEQKNCLFVTGAKRVKNGRPARQFIIPDNQKLYKLFNARPSGSDSLAPADLRSPSAYRQALQRALVERRPGLYSRHWLSARLGISVWTCRRYDQQIGLKVSATYFSTRITWANVDHLPPSVPYKDGVFLETPDGKRYPPVRGLAKRLLQRHVYLIQKRQHWNYYMVNDGIKNEYYEKLQNVAERVICEKIHNHDSVDDPEQVPVAAVESSPPAAVSATCAQGASVEPAPSLWVCSSCMKQMFSDAHPGACPRCGEDHWEAATADVWRDPAQCGPWWRDLWQRHKQPSEQPLHAQPPGLTPDQRKMADTLYTTVRTQTPARALTYAAARQLVLDCGEVAVERALALLAERRNVYNAAGFMMSVLRGATGHGERAASSASQSHEDWLARVTQSPYARFYANEV